MEMTALFNMQRELDAFIEGSKEITYDVFEEKSLALLIELSELANETRCFKYWSTKGASPQSVLLEEFVDSIHFMLSLGIMKGFTCDQWQGKKEKVKLTTLFIDTQRVILQFIAEPTQAHYEKIWQNYYSLAYNLDFDAAAITDAYIQKNQKNYERQRTGY